MNYAKIIIKNYYDFLPNEYKNISENEVRNILFISKKRLSKNGVEIFLKIFQPYIIKLQKNQKLLNKHIIFFETEFEYPYYLCYKDMCLYVFGKKEAMKLKMSNSDIDTLTDNFMIDRKNNP